MVYLHNTFASELLAHPQLTYVSESLCLSVAGSGSQILLGRVYNTPNASTANVSILTPAFKIATDMSHRLKLVLPTIIVYTQTFLSPRRIGLCEQKEDQFVVYSGFLDILNHSVDSAQWQTKSDLSPRTRVHNAKVALLHIQLEHLVLNEAKMKGGLRQPLTDVETTKRLNELIGGVRMNITATAFTPRLDKRNDMDSAPCFLELQKTILEMKQQLSLMRMENQSLRDYLRGTHLASDPKQEVCCKTEQQISGEDDELEEHEKSLLLTRELLEEYKKENEALREQNSLLEQTESKLRQQTDLMEMDNRALLLELKEIKRQLKQQEEDKRTPVCSSHTLSLLPVLAPPRKDQSKACQPQTSCLHARNQPDASKKPDRQQVRFAGASYLGTRQATQQSTSLLDNKANKRSQGLTSQAGRGSNQIDEKHVQCKPKLCQRRKSSYANSNI
ncbi:unnamed protein product [Dicrocoelium dendriticum]|nr:unnamed protein product [Dicrocoelium dendriticum]